MVINMNNNEPMPRTEGGEPAVKKKSSYRGYTFKERLLPSILLAILAPLCVCCVAPFEIFGGNLSEFKFVLMDFWGYCLLIGLCAAAILATVLLLCRGRAFDVVFGVIYGLSIMFFIQSNYLSLAQTSLSGDGNEAGAAVWKIVLNTAIWVAVTVGCVLVMLLLNRHKDTVRLIATMVLIVMIFMSLVSVLTVSLTTDILGSDSATETVTETETEIETSAPETTTSSDSQGAVGSETGEGTGTESSTAAVTESATETETETEAPAEPDVERLLTVENLNTFASGQNILVFIVDRFAAEYYIESLVECPEIFDELAGFTFFEDYISRYPRTFPAIPHLITGVETDFSLSREDYFKSAYQTAPLMYALKDQGYDINIYTDTYYGYNNAAYMAGYASNLSLKSSYKIVKKPRLSLDMLRLALYRSLPAVAQPVVGDISTPTFEKYVKYDAEHEVYKTDMKGIYEWVTAEDFTLREAEKGYSFIHLSGCHLPNQYNADFGPVSDADKYSSTVAMQQSFKIINRYIRELKRLGLYENSTIIITGDHASIGSDRKYPYYPHLTGLMVKPAGVATGETVISSAPIQTEDIFATILQEANAPLLDAEWRTVFEIEEDEIRTRRYHFQCYLPDSKQYDEGIYEITGPGNAMENWKLVEIRHLNKSIYS